MGLPDLPIDIFYLITAFLTLDSDISAFSQASRQLRNLLDDYLYQHNIKYSGGYALEWAAINGNAIVVQKMLKAGASPFTTFKECMQPMCLACFHGHDDVVKVFLDWGLRPNGEAEWWARPEPNCFPSDYIDAKWEDFDDPESSDKNNNPLKPQNQDEDPLSLAISGGHDSLVYLLHANGGMSLDRARWLMGSAISQGNLNILELFAKEYPEIISEWIETKMSSMGRLYGRTDTSILFFLKAGLSPDTTTPNGLALLACAAIFGKTDIIRIIVDAGASPFPMNPSGVSLWPMKLALGKPETIRYLFTLVDIESKISAGGDDVAIILFAAASHGFEDIVGKVLNAGFHPDLACNPFDERGVRDRTALTMAVQRGHVGVVRILLEKGADPNKIATSEDSYGSINVLSSNILITACIAGNFELAKLLLDFNVNVNLRNFDINSTDFWEKPALAESIPFPPLFDMLLNRGANCDMTWDDNGVRNIMCEAVGSGNVTIVQRLLDYGVQLEVPKSPFEYPHPRTMVVEAVQGGVAMLKFLHPYGIIAVPGSADAQIEMRRAIITGNLEVTEYLLDQGFVATPKGSYDPDEVMFPGFKEDLDSYLADAASGADDPEVAAAMVDLLLSRGAKIEDLKTCPRYEKQQCSHLYEKQLRAVRLLLERGASPLPTHDFGLDALEVAAKSGHKGMVKLLLSFVEKLDISLKELHANLVLAESISYQSNGVGTKRDWHIIRLWRQLYWRRRHPVPK